MSMRLNIEEIIIKVKVVDQAKLKAIVSLDFGDFVVKGFRVQISQYENEKGDKLWITPPSYRAATGKYHPIFYVLKKDQWEVLEKRILDEYKSQTDAHHRKVYGLPSAEEEQIDVEGINF